MTNELIPFWSYGVKSLRMEILLNIILFIPVGLLAPRWKTVGLAAGYSLLIELAHLVNFRGLFEFDDVIHNALGTAIGVLIVLGIRRVISIKSKSGCDGVMDDNRHSLSCIMELRACIPEGDKLVPGTARKKFSERTGSVHGGTICL